LSRVAGEARYRKGYSAAQFRAKERWISGAAPRRYKNLDGKQIIHTSGRKSSLLIVSATLPLSSSTWISARP
jgi:hypothetical protein